MSHSTRIGLALAACLAITAASAAEAPATANGGNLTQPMHWRDAPKVVLISLDGAKPDLIRHYIRSGVLSPHRGLGLLSRRGVVARQNITATPSLTAVSHIAIATGSTAAHNDIPANFYHPVAAPIISGISGFGGPIGGYTINPLGIDTTPTAEPMWVRLRDAGKAVVTATWPGGDGVDVRINNVIVQAANPTRVVDYTVPFGAGGGLSATGFSLTAANFAPDPTIAAQLAAAGHPSFSPVLVTIAPFETFFCASTTAGNCGTTGSATLDLPFRMKAAAIDTTDDGAVNYSSLAIFSELQGIAPGPFLLPATGPAYAEAGGPSARFFFEGTGNRIGTGYFVSTLAPDLSTVRFARYAANFIPRNAPVIADVDDINENVGFWGPQPDFRIPQRVSTTFAPFSDAELEAMYEDQVETFVRYQSGVAQRAIRSNPGADLIMIYIEEPDGSGHQFTLTDPRQATDPRDPESIFWNQDRDKVRRYERYIRFAYQQADKAVQDIMALVGPKTNVFVVSDHGMAPFHTQVNARNILRNAGFTDCRAQPALDHHIRLRGQHLRQSAGPRGRRHRRRGDLPHAGAAHRRCAFKCEGSEPGVQLLAPSPAHLHQRREAARPLRCGRFLHQQRHRPGFWRRLRHAGARLQF